MPRCRRVAVLAVACAVAVLPFVLGCPGERGPRRLLVYTACYGFRHGSIPVASEAIEALGQESGAFETVVTDDMDMFEPARLKEFDAVCLNNTTGELFGLKPHTKIESLPPEQQEKVGRLRQSLMDFVRGGKGIVGIHAATDCSYEWAEYGEMMGGYFDGHPWHEEVGVKIDDPEHPLCAVFGGEGFTIKDEIYVFRAPYSRKRLRVLLSLDMEKTSPKGKRSDNDYAVAWVRGWGKGRVFYCSLGHRNEIFKNPKVLRFYLDGIRFALGDLPADTTPSEAGE